MSDRIISEALYQQLVTALTLMCRSRGSLNPVPAEQHYNAAYAALTALKAAPIADHLPDAGKMMAPQAQTDTLRAKLQRRCSKWGAYWRAPDSHGVELSMDQAVELLEDALGVEVEIDAQEVNRG